ncbi:MAG TPA: isochorismate synthase [Pseudogracilibacillus sp.]|nr:isochorismate synthase [Pseudogracilibacillus sp.]
MIFTKDITFQTFVDELFQNDEIEKTDTKLISWTTEIEPISLLSVFQAAKNKVNNRMFWSNHNRTFSYVGIGVAKKILVQDDDRFTSLESQWKQVLQEAHIYNPYKTSGTGLVGIGGMSFDPRKKRTKLWEHFPSSQLTIPELLVLETEGRYYLTINQLINSHSSKESLIDHVNQLKRVCFVEQIVKKTKHRIMNKVEIDPEGWKTKVQKAVDEIKAGHVKKIVMAREMQLQFDQETNIAHLIQRLLMMQANSYIYAIEHDGHCFIGATPERLVEVHGKQLLSACIAGTAPRGKTIEEDDQIGQQLLNDTKNREEHDYVVQMIRKQITPYCEEVFIADEPILHPLKNLQHLYTPVSATLKKQVSIFEIVKQLHPTPALGGEPREESLAFIREHESLDRGWYGAPVGWLDSNDNGEFVVAIRSGLIKPLEASLFAGCGVMGDSDPEMEYEETNVKFMPMLHMLEDEDEAY